MPAARSSGPPHPQAGGLLSGGFSLDSGGRIGLFRGEHSPGNDPDQPHAPIGWGGGNRVPGVVRANLSRGTEGRASRRRGLALGWTRRPGSTALNTVGRTGMDEAGTPRLTPWVARLMMVNAGLF